jgi:hypothetical protein
MLTGFNSISRILIYWDICETQYLKHLERETYQMLIGPLIDLYSHIIEYQARTICHLSMTQLSRGWQKTLGSNDWAAHMEKLESIHISCTNYIGPIKEREIWENANKQLQAIQESRDILDEIRAIVGESLRKTQTNFEDQQERQLLENLAADHKSFKDFNPQRVHGTCEWFLNHDEFQQWRDSNNSGLLWVSAGPGCGKSVLSRMLIDENRLSTHVTTSTVCYFFFKAGDSRRTHCTDALSSVLHQLFMQDRSGNLIKIAKTADREYGKTLRENLSQLWELLLDCAKSPDAGQIICVLDALDECDELSREQFLHKLKEFYCGPSQVSNPPAQLKFLVTSRPYDEIEASFDEFTETCCVHLDGDEKLTDISHDIDLVIDDKVKKLSRLSPDDQKKIAQRLKQMENRTYLWLYLTFNIIEKRRSQHSRRVDIEGLLSKLPSAVTDAYEQILNQGADEERTRILLQIVLAAERPLTLNEANEILTLAFQTQEDPITTHAQLCSEKWPADTFPSAVRNMCGLFLSIHESKLYFIHLTAREFLLHRMQKGSWQGHFSITLSHRIMSQLCLDYLLLTDMPRNWRIVDYYFGRYASEYWYSHYNSQASLVTTQYRLKARILCRAEEEGGSRWGFINIDRLEQYLEPHCEWKVLLDLCIASDLGLVHAVEDIILEIHEKNELQVAKVISGSNNDQTGHVFTEEHCQTQEAALSTRQDYHTGDVIRREGFATALQQAARKGHKDIVQLLLDNGVDIDYAPKGSEKAQQIATRKGRSEVIQLLEGHRAAMQPKIDSV